MKLHNYFKDLNRFEWGLFISSLLVVSASYLFSNGGALNLIASLIGVTAVIFVSKGYVLGQVLTVVFSLLYGFISYHFHYYGEMITYMCMTMPVAIAAVISWIKNPYKETREVRVHRLTVRQAAVIFLISEAVTFIFYFILKALGTANLILSTISVTTSMLASSLTVARSPWYAVAYSANDLVLIILWILASAENISYLPMIFCFVMFLANDMYGYFNWRRMATKQKEAD